MKKKSCKNKKISKPRKLNKFKMKFEEGTKIKIHMWLWHFASNYRHAFHANDIRTDRRMKEKKIYKKSNFIEFAIKCMFVCV